MKDAQKPDHISLNTIINRLKEGRYVIPDFQREFEWKPWDVRDLMRSIFLDYYIGSLLLWKGKQANFEALSCEAVYGYTESGSPEHIVLDGQQRLKNAAMDSDYYEKLSGKLEYFDLRELQDTITGKSLWEKFAERFMNKETLNGKFGQLAELRNGIRHSRTVDEVTRKEGEAAILWFKKVIQS